MRSQKNVNLKLLPYVYQSPADCVAKIYKHERALTGVFRGLGITLLREAPAFTVYFGSYAYLCDKVGAIREDGVDLVKLVCCGGTAGALSWLLTSPQDVIKTRLQTDGMGKTLYRGILHCGREIYREGGWRAFCKGLNASLIRAFPANGVTLATVTMSTRYLESMRQEIR